MTRLRLFVLLLAVLLSGLTLSPAHALVCSGPCNGGMGCWTSADGNHPWTCTTPCPCGGGSHSSSTTSNTPQETSGPVETGPPSSPTGRVDDAFLKNNFQPGNQIPPPQGPGVSYGVGGPVETPLPPFTWPPPPSSGPGPYKPMGDRPGWKEFQDAAAADWARINRQIQAFEQFLQKNQEAMDTLRNLRDQLADGALDQADKTWNTFREGAVDELTGQAMGLLGDSSEAVGTALEWQEHMETAQGLVDNGLGDTLEDLARAPASLLYYVGDVLDDLSRAQGLAQDLEHVNQIMDDMYKAQQPMRDYIDSLKEYRDRLGQAIQDTQNAFFSSGDPSDALADFQAIHDDVNMLTGSVDLNITTVVPGQTSQIPGVDMHYWDHSATFTLMPPSN